MILKITKLIILSAFIKVLISAPALALNLAGLQKNNTLDSGFVSILFDKTDDKVYLKIDNLGQQFIYQTSLPSGLGSNDIGLDRGQLGNTRLAVFERLGNKVLLKQRSDYYRAITSNPLEAAAIDEAFASSILWGFKVVDSGQGWVLVDASDFILQDIHGVGRILAEQEQGEGYAVDASRSAIDLQRSKAFEDNTELQAIITLVGTKPGAFVEDTSPDPYAITLKMRHSFVRLPKDGYQARGYMPKSGYWSVEYRDYAQPINASVTQKMIGRHRLQKLDPNATISEPVEPIIYYLDPGVPEPVRSALIEGALWWNSAFDDIGFKNAFQVKMLPADADPMDVRYNVIQWVHRATRGWSYGSSVIDPRSGEIIKGHVTLGSLRVRQDYLIAQGMLAPFSQNEDDRFLMELALARIRQLSAHEVGHTLGINHNFAASNYGRESVMDYPHPLFELDPSDQSKVIAPNAYGVGIGKWDGAAVAYGYQVFADNADEQELLRAVIDQSDSQGLLYITGADARSPGSPHADASLWDNGADAVEELSRMIAVRNAAMSNFGSANLKSGRNWSDLEEIFVPVYYSTRFQIQAAAKWLGGLRYQYLVKDQSGVLPRTDVVSGADQQRALDALIETLAPEYLAVPTNLSTLFQPKPAEYYRTRESANGDAGVAFDPVSLAAASAQHTLSLILNSQRLVRIAQQSAIDPSIASISDIGKRLHTQIVIPQATGLAALIHQSVVDLLISNYLNLLHNKDVSGQVKGQVLSLIHAERDYFGSALKKAKQSSSYYGFFAYQQQRLNNISLEQTDTLIELPKMPPGSPI